MADISFSIPFLVLPKQGDRARAIVPKSGKPFVQHYQPRKVTENQADLAVWLAPYVPPEPLTGPLHLDVTFGYPWRTSESAKARKAGACFKHTKPDVDNLLKQLLDCMEKMQFFTNDAQVAVVNATKEWRNISGVDVEMWRLTEDLNP